MTNSISIQRVQLTDEERGIVERFMRQWSIETDPDGYLLNVLRGLLSYYISKAHGLKWFDGERFIAWNLVEDRDGWQLEGIPGDPPENPGDTERLWHMLHAIWEAAHRLEGY